MNYEQSKKSIEKINTELKKYASLVGKNSCDIIVPQIGIAEGLGMMVDSKNLFKKAEDIRKGIFKVLAMGEFKQGKSTLINAVVGKKTVQVKTTACTAIITILVYGSRNKKAFVYMKNNSNPVEMNLDDFFEEYELTPEDEDIIREEGYLDRFSDVEYAVIECEHPIIKNGVRIIDSPGLGEADSRNKTSMNFIPNADAIIFLLNATKLFSKEEKNYIRENFVDRGFKNIFFVVNRINQISEPIEELIPTIKTHLSPVFRDEKGNVDEELLESRIFYVDAYGAFKAKEEGDLNKLEGTGFGKFEKSLEKFLVSEDRLIATFQSTLTSMSNTYKKAEIQIEDKKRALTIPLVELRKNHIESEKILKNLENKIEEIKKIYRSTYPLVQSKIYYSLIEYVSIQMPKMWDKDAEKLNIKFGIGDMGKLATTVFTISKEKRTGKQNKIMEKLANEIKEYIINKLEDWGKTSDSLVKSEIEKLYTDLSMQGEEFSLELMKASKVFSGGLTDKYLNSTSVNSVQLGLSLIFMDPSIFVENAAGGNYSWGKWIRKFVVQVIIQSMIFGLFTGGLAWIVFILVEAIQINKSKGKLKNKLLKEISVKLFKKLKEEVEKNKDEIFMGIQSKFEEQLELICNESFELINDERRRQNEIINSREKKEVDFNKESNRLDLVIAKMREILGDVYFEIYNKKMTKNNFDKLGFIEYKDNSMR